MKKILIFLTLTLNFLLSYSSEYRHDHEGHSRVHGEICVQSEKEVISKLIESGSLKVTTDEFILFDKNLEKFIKTADIHHMSTYINVINNYPKEHNLKLVNKKK